MVKNPESKDEVLAFIRENPVFHLATSQNNRPFVRIMRVISADSNGIIFNTKRYKKSFEQLSDNSSVELCFYNESDDIQIRVWGRVEMKIDHSLVEKIVSDFPKLEGIVEKHGYGAIVPFILEKWEHQLCTRH